MNFYYPDVLLLFQEAGCDFLSLVRKVQMNYAELFCLRTAGFRAPTSSGNHGKPGKSRKKVYAWKNHGILKKPE